MIRVHLASFEELAFGERLCPHDCPIGADITLDRSHVYTLHVLREARSV